MSGKCLRSTFSLFAHTHCPVSSRETKGNPTTQKAEDPGRPPLRILVAEDDPISRMFITRALLKCGHTVKSVKDGKEALTVLLKGKKFDALLTDIQMPHVDGITLTSILRQEKEYRHHAQLSIIAMTAYAISGDREKFLQAGMDDYIPKPINMKMLDIIIKKISSPPQ